MGLNFLASSSTFDAVKAPINFPDQKFPNPNPKNFKILKSEQVKNYLLIKVNYPDCTNYEGDKILLFVNCKLTELLQQHIIDPHFSENKKFFTPIARFEPTEIGWKMGLSLAWKMSHIDEVIENLRTATFHMDDKNAKIVMERWFMSYPELLFFHAKEWYYKHC